MKRIILLIMILLLTTQVYSYIIAEDDFDRTNNENITVGYTGNVEWLERPINGLAYNNDLYVDILNNKLRTSTAGTYTGTGNVARWGEEFTEYADGNITWTMTESVTSGNRYYGGYGFGSTLVNRSVSWNAGNPARDGWFTYWTEATYNSLVFASMNFDRVSTTGTVNIAGCTGGTNLLTYSWTGATTTWTVSFDVDGDALKWWKDGVYVGEATGCNSAGVTYIDSWTSTMVDNNGGGFWIWDIDDFKVQGPTPPVVEGNTGTYKDQQGWCPTTGGILKNISLEITQSGTGEVLFRYNQTNSSLTTLEYQNLTTNGTNNINFVGFSPNDCIYYELYLEDSNSIDTPEITSYTINEEKLIAETTSSVVTVLNIIREGDDD